MGTDKAGLFGKFVKVVNAEIADDDVPVHRDLATAYLAMGLVKDAIAELELVVRASPGDAEAQALLDELRRKSSR